MRTYDAIECISKSCISSGLCNSILLKGSIGRGDDDEYSDVDMYLVVDEDKITETLSKRDEFLGSYGSIVYKEEANFGVPQIIVIYDNGLHVDLYVGTSEQIGTLDPLKVWYDPNGLYDGYEPKRKDMDESVMVSLFNDALYYFVEADSAYQRGNHPWTVHILTGTLTNTSILLRYHYDKKYAFLGLKKINEILPKEEYFILDQATRLYGEGDYTKGNKYLMEGLGLFVTRCSKKNKDKLNLAMFEWLKVKLQDTFFISSSVINT